MDFALNSIIGKRENQEDYGVIKSSGASGGVLALIADGMGGQVAGEVASSTAVNGFVESFTSNNSKNLPLKLYVAVHNANRALTTSISTNPKLRGMGTTLIAAQIDSNSISWISVGDSILYLYREKKLQRLNDDHSMMPKLQDSVRLGKITHEEARVHPHRNALRSALTGEEVPIIDLREEPFRLKKGDLILLATDGVLTLSEPEIGSILERCKDQSAKAIVDQLLSAVTQKNKPRQDNTLVEVIKISGGRRTNLKWSEVVTAISVSVITIALCFFAWEKKTVIFKGLGLMSKQEASSKPVEVVPIPLEDNHSATDNKIAPVVISGEHPKTAPAPAPETVLFNKNSRQAEDKKSAASSRTVKTEVKAPLKVDALTKTDVPQGSAQPSMTPQQPRASDPNGGSAAPATSPAKTGSAPKADGDKAKQLLESDHTTETKTDADRKE